jgi:hypothetical protein
MDELNKEKILRILQGKGDEKQNLQYVFCLPGNPSSGVQSMNVTKLFIDFLRMGITFGIAHAEANNIYAVRNACLAGNKFRKNQKPFGGRFETYNKIIWIDSDNVVSTDQVLRLLSHDVDIVAAWYRMYNSVGLLNETNNAACGLLDVGTTGYSRIRPYKVSEIPHLLPDGNGLVSVDYSGMGLMVVKHGIFESLDYPWFRSWLIEWKEDVVKDGEVVEKDVEMADIVTDDLGFCLRAKEKGFKIFVDPLVQIGHQKRVNV